MSTLSIKRKIPAKQAEVIHLDSTRHIRSLNGIRGLAILLVIAVHYIVAGGYYVPFLYQAASFGSSGVDLFFVLSGFLITGILLDTKSKRGYFKNFYIKRLLRIFPLYYLFLIVIMFVLPAFGSSIISNEKFSYLHQNSLWYWLYLSNIKFSIDNVGDVFFYTWSLSVEEQFYLIFPMLVWYLNRRNLIILLVFLYFFAFAFRIYSYIEEFNFTWIYSHTLSKIDMLSIGALIAVIFRSNISGRRIIKYASVFFIIGLIWISTIYVSFDGYWWLNKYVYLYGFSITALFFGALISLAIISETHNGLSDWQIGKLKILNTCLNNKFLVTFGKYAYSLYLFHELVKDSIRYILNTKEFKNFIPTDKPFVLLTILIFFGVGVTFLLSKLSWHFFEKPILSLKSYLIP